MLSGIVIAACGVLTLAVVFLFLMGLAAHAEAESRALWISMLLALPGLVMLFVLIVFSPGSLSILLSMLIVAGAVGGLLVIFLPWMPRMKLPDMSSATRFDERDHMFARARLIKYPELRQIYYESHPERREIDQKIHALPELGEEGGRLYDPALSPMADAAFSLLDRSYPVLAERPRVAEKHLSAEELLQAITLLAHRYGAADLGVTRMQPHQWYSHGGRQAEEWGRPIEAVGDTAIVIVVPMDVRAIRLAPGAPVLAESARLYVEAAKIAHILAEYLQLQGRRARAHVDGRYQVLCVPLAEAAGLGHVGRMGILMHRVYGPCVRLSVVTTDAKLPTSEADFSWMESFCEICKKCAENCPSRAIPMETKPSSRGFRHWSIDQESCYAFWRRVGSDCSVCIASCPFSKPDTFVHRCVRFSIRRNRLAQRLALLGDDLFYGRKYKIRPENPKVEDLHRILR